MVADHTGWSSKWLREVIEVIIGYHRYVIGMSWVTITKSRYEFWITVPMNSFDQHRRAANNRRFALRSQVCMMFYLSLSFLNKRTMLTLGKDAAMATCVSRR